MMRMSGSRVRRSVATPLALVAGCVLLLVAGTPARGTSIGTADDFNDNRKNPALWGRDDIEHAGAIGETHGRLEYTVASPTRKWDYAGRPLVWGDAPHDSGWSVEMDVRNAARIARAKQYASFGISVHPCGTWADEMYVELYATNLPVWRGVYAQLWAGDTDRGDADSGDLTGALPLAALLRISYDGAAKVLTAAYDTGGGATTLGTFDIANGGTGTAGNGDWGLAAGDRICVQPFGYSEHLRVTSGKLSGDNFGVQGVTPRKVFLISPNGGEVLPAGGHFPIFWYNPANVDHVRLRYSCNRGRTWRAIDPQPAPGDTIRDWIVPTPRANQRACYVKASAFNAANKALGSDRSDKPFRIEVVRLDTPNGGETLLAGAPYEVTWTTNATAAPVDHVLLFFSVDGGKHWRKIDTSADAADDGSFFWTPSVAAQKTRGKVRLVLKAADGRTLGADTSDAVFTIDPAP